MVNDQVDLSQRSQDKPAEPVWLYWALILLTLIGLSLPLVLSLASTKDVFYEQSARAGFSANALKTAASSLSEQLRLNPPGKLLLKETYDEFRIGVMHSSPNPKVVISDNAEWLFSLSPDIGLPNYTNTRPITPEWIEHWKQFIEQRVEWFSARGIIYIMVMAPSKSSVYPEQVPHRIKKSEITPRFQQLMASLTPDTQRHVVDLTDLMRDQSRTEQNFFRLDSHWNFVGAHRAYLYLLPRIQALAAGTGIELPEHWSKPVEVERYHVDRAPRNDLARMLNNPIFMTEGTDMIKPLAAEPTREDLPMSALTTLANPKLSHSSPFYPYVLSQSDPSGTLPRCIAFRDSFFHMLEPFIAQHCSRLTLLKHLDKIGVPALQIDVPYIAREQPQIVIEEFVERLLTRPHNLPPVMLGEQESNQFPVPTHTVVSSVPSGDSVAPSPKIN